MLINHVTLLRASLWNDTAMRSKAFFAPHCSFFGAPVWVWNFQNRAIPARIRLTEADFAYILIT